MLWDANAGARFDAGAHERLHAASQLELGDAATTLFDPFPLASSETARKQDADNGDHD